MTASSREMKTTNSIILVVTSALVFCGCQGRDDNEISPHSGAESPTIGPFTGVYSAVSSNAAAALAKGDEEPFSRLRQNISAMMVFSLWTLYPTGSTYEATSDNAFTRTIYEVYEAELTHWKRVMLFGGEKEKHAALRVMRERARSLVNGYPISANATSYETLAFATILAEMSAFILPDLGVLVSERMPSWDERHQVPGLCVLAHCGDADARLRLAGLNRPENQCVIVPYRVTAHLPTNWPNKAPEATR